MNTTIILSSVFAAIIAGGISYWMKKRKEVSVTKELEVCVLWGLVYVYKRVDVDVTSGDDDEQT
jgi:hypothetical protein